MKHGISLVIPLLNEQDSITELYFQLKDLIKKEFADYLVEIIFVNDGSSDNSLKILRELESKDKAIKIISFRKNLGKAMALNQGFKKASGEIVATLDADLQDGLENIPLLLQKLNEGYDLVTGWKKERFDPLSKTIPSKIFNFFVSKTSGIPLHDFNSGLKLMKKEVAKELYLYGGLHRFIPFLAIKRGFNVVEIPITHHPRKFGKSKYGGGRLVKGLFDFLAVVFLDTYSQRPLLFFGSLGMAGLITGLISAGYLSILHFQGETIGRRPLLTLSMLLIIAGLQFLSIGFIAEMIVRKSKNIDERLPVDYETD